MSAVVSATAAAIAVLTVLERRNRAAVLRLGRLFAPAGPAPPPGRFIACARAVGAWRRRRRTRPRLRAEAVSAAELLAACLSAGAAPIASAEAVAALLPGPVGQAFAEVTRSARRGVSLERCWVPIAALPEFGTIARILARSSVSGVPAAAAMSAEAATLRRRRRAEADAALARIGVWAVAPLAVCFLPAFVCLGIVPLAASVAPRILS